jgi:hypothetical protein
MPLTELWTDQGSVPARRARSIGETEIATLLGEPQCTFVVATAGRPLRWIALGDRYAFWKNEVKRRLVARDASSFRLEDFPDSYCYVASEWRTDQGPYAILLEKHH